MFKQIRYTQILSVVFLSLFLAVAGCHDDDDDDVNDDGVNNVDNGDGDGSSNGGGSSNDGFPGIELTEFASGFVQPTHVTHAGDDSGRLFVVEQAGRIHIVRDGEVEPTPFLDITGRVGDAQLEQGLLGLAFPPGFSDDKEHFYVNYTDTNGDTVVARFSLASDNPDAGDPDSEERLLQVDQPFANHNGGQLAFGPDGFLFIALGDGGSAGDPEGNGQDRDTLLGSLLRIDVEHDGPEDYLIPDDNPFGDEIWAYGLRNPWRFSFDRDDGGLYIADAGEQMREEVNFQPASGDGGENYGWNIMEGSQCFSSASCDETGLTLPVAEYDTGEDGCSIIGGHVYRAEEFSDLQGIYFYGDYCSGTLWGLRQVDGDWEDEILLETPYRISTFGENEDGDIFVADYSGGAIYKIEQTGDGAS